MVRHHTRLFMFANVSKTHKNRRGNRNALLWTKLESLMAEDEPDIVASATATATATATTTASKSHGMECVYNPSGNREVCDVCQSNLVITEDGFATCTNSKCSIIYKDSLDYSAEWRFYGADDNQMTDPTRCGMPVNPLLMESSYGCKVMCEGASSYEMRKIRRYTEWQSMPYAEKALYDEFERIKNTASNAGIPKMIIDCALRYHKKISEHKTFRGENRDGIISASIYVSCRMNDCPRTPKEIATIFHLNNKSATKGCKNAMAIINELECNLENSEKTNFEKTKPNAFIERYCSPLNMNLELTKLCIFVAMRIEQNNMIPENTPHAIAAGIIYFVAQVCNLNITKKDVNRISQISEVTINKCFKKLESIKTQLIPPSIVQKYSVAS
jgi:transcription initiation factor TFIIB